MARDSCEISRTKTAFSAQGLLRAWLSPFFPVGAYAYSHGLEAAVARGQAATREALEDWLRVLLQVGSVRNDIILLAAAWRAAHAQDEAGLVTINDLALTLQPSAERYLETAQQGTSFAAAIAAAWPCASIERLRAAVEGDIAYPIAVGVASAGHDIEIGETAAAYALAFVQNLTSAAIRLAVIGQTDGQRILAALMPDIETTAALAGTASLDDLGGAVFLSDLSSLEHETLYSRLFRS